MRIVYFFVDISPEVCLQLMSERVETQFWVTKTVWQQIPSQLAPSSKAPTTETVQLIAWCERPAFAKWQTTDVDSQLTSAVSVQLSVSSCHFCLSVCLFVFLSVCLTCRATEVPVGDDQIKHIELTRHLAKLFNHKYNCTLFPLPTPVTGLYFQLKSFKYSSYSFLTVVSLTRALWLNCLMDLYEFTCDTFCSMWYEGRSKRFASRYVRLKGEGRFEC